MRIAGPLALLTALSSTFFNKVTGLVTVSGKDIRPGFQQTPASFYIRKTKTMSQLRNNILTIPGDSDPVKYSSKRPIV